MGLTFTKQRIKRILFFVVSYVMVSLFLSAIFTGISFFAFSHQKFGITSTSATIGHALLFPFQLILPEQVVPSFHIWIVSLDILSETQHVVQNVKNTHQEFINSSILPDSQRNALLTNIKIISPKVEKLNQLLYQSFFFQMFFPQQTTQAKEYVQIGQQAVQLAELVFTHYTELTDGTTDKNYLILFQNDRELRPTGGFLGSYAQVHFSQGKWENLEVQDIYVPDGQLPGRVAPPQPIQDAFQQGFWRLRDANWHPDVSQSAETINWFFTEGTKHEIDGNVFITYQAIESMLNEVGPLYLPDYRKTISAEELYAFLQTEVEEDFFPGSTKKKDVLSAVTHQFFVQLQNLPIEKKIHMVKIIRQLLDEKYLVVSIRQPEINEYFRQQNWAGTLEQHNCEKSDCTADYISIFDANLGVNKANCCVQRSVDVDKTWDSETGQLATTLNLTYLFKEVPENQKQFINDYKVFSRIYVPFGSTLKGIRINDIDYQSFIQSSITNKYLYPNTHLQPTVDVVSGLHEFGFWVYVPVQETTKVEIRYDSPLQRSKNYELQIQKQPGSHDEYNNWQVNFDGKKLMNQILYSDHSFSYNN